MINHDFLDRAIGCEDARGLYASLEQLLSWDYHYWLQRGSLEVENGDLSLAENFLGQARGLANDDPLVENEWAYLLFRQALQAPKSLEAPKQAEEARASLEDLIARRGALDPYPYHVLGSQGLAWARRGIVASEDKGRYLAKLIKVLEEGVKRHADAADLRQLLEDIRREYYSLAVSGKR
jgi:hypothetical protein